ncbi:MAG: hypothetical protein C0404_12700 [Verrucomicrobia bacterium]|nr:hypothetical protein [Verrucomicrobiota bacterium]
MGQALEAAFETDVCDLAVGKRELPGCVIQAGQVDDVSWRSSQDLLCLPCHMFRAAPGQPDERRGAAGEMLRFLDFQAGAP